MNQKEEMLKVGLRLFSTQTYSSTGIRQITKAAGVPTGSFHYHFKNKEDFAIAVLDYYFKIEVADNAKSQYFLDDSIPVKNKIIKLYSNVIHSYTGNAEMNPPNSAVVSNLGQELSAHNQKVKAHISMIIEKSHLLLKGLIEQGKIDKSITSKIDAGLLANLLIDLYGGALIRRKSLQSDAPMDDFILALEKIL
ncbi:hypothetical protein DNU06_16825 [Putridiphycobacter roseus]|uniref:HTH tetR-type domain-containing protein n=1 Tax=Putridiphycobacter roseus TaxID=2219161 RepID=A0A2W1MWZ0_9FLAO|nr:TetR/AcrR family transcriptional regulator [Putridiphycobacter roseus]PZE15670.1 hypothetical protein DNU06_16825 [Putridiphycobacter roseus]